MFFSWNARSRNTRVEATSNRPCPAQVAYAGAGKHSRTQQLIIGNHDDCCLAGGQPWETPFAEIVGEASFRTLAGIYTGYGEKGPAQSHLRTRGWTSDDAKRFPLLDHITSCALVDDETSPADWQPYPAGFLHPNFRGRASVAEYVIEGAPP